MIGKRIRGAAALLAMAVAVGGLLTAEARATVILADNLSATTDGTSTVSGDVWMAASFATDGADYVLSDVTLLLQRLSADGQPTLALYSDGGLEPGSLVGLLTPPAATSTSLAATTFLGNGLTLSANSTYWLVLQGGSGEFDWAWTASNAGSGVGFRVAWGESDDAGASWFTTANYPFQMSVSASPAAVPEPSTAGLLAIGAASMLAASRVRRAPRRSA